ncbi:hypothetical protein [Aeoliella sp.]|uniref:hypothetical protein n=1 Tax=Aeoliella sp. TaxID=2795800 RepID=UPI003CCBFF40
MRSQWLLVGACASVLFGAVTRAEVIHDNGEPILETSYPYSDLSFGSIYADDFQLPQGENIIRDVHWYGGYNGQTPDTSEFELRIYTHEGDRPAMDDYQVLSVVAGPVSVEQPGTSPARPLYRYSVAVDPFEATPGTQYWLSIIETSPDSAWLWARSDGGNDISAWRPIEQGEPWRLVSGPEADVAISLTDDGVIVPEPSSLALVAAIGLLVVAARAGTDRLM